MPRALSLYLDLVRFTMAVVVFLSHFALSRISGGFLWQLAPYGSYAVDVFFVLSGYVIAFVTTDRDTTPAAYIVNRAARILSVAVPALVLTLLLDWIGRSVSPAVYEAVPGHPNADRGWIVGSSLLFANEFWFNAQSMGSNVPFWSLCFEVWYYVLFGIWSFVRSKFRIVFLLLVLVGVGPKIALLFPLWLIGVACERMREKIRLKSWVGLILIFLPIAIFVGCRALGMGVSDPNGRLDFSTKFLAPFAWDYVVGVLFAVHLIGITATAPLFVGTILRFQEPIRWLAGRSFSLYLFHYPVIHFIAATMPWVRTSWQGRSIVFAGTLIVVFLLAEVTEQQRTPWRRWISKALGQVRHC